VQYPKPHQLSETPTIASLVISKVLLTQSIMAGFVHRHSSSLSDDCPGLPTNIMPHILQNILYGNFLFTCTGTCIFCPNIKIKYYVLFS